MLFNSWEFIFLFVPITFAVFLLLRRFAGFNSVLIWLSLASLFFYGYWNPIYLLLIIASMTVNYIIGRGLMLLNQGRPDLNKRKIKVLLFIGVTLNLLVIGYFKYAAFFAENLRYFGLTWDPGRIILPLGISFFSFQKIAFLVDAARGEVKRIGVLEYILFVTFFPQLIAGPIVHHKEIMPQFAESRYKNYIPSVNQLFLAFSVFLIGLVKKVVFADGIAEYANPVFNASLAQEKLGFYDAWSGALSYTLQLYFDFSGYCDMAIGVALLFGIVLPENFNSPYKSVNIIDFWRRWHITLSRFLRDYLYIPLGGNRKGFVRKEINLMLTMLLGGLWHGASWSFVLWGGLHGLYLVINHLWDLIKTKTKSLPNLGYLNVFLARSITLLAVVVAWVFFRAETLDSGFHIVSNMFNLSSAANLPYFWDSPALTSFFKDMGSQKTYRFFDSVRQLYWLVFLIFIALFAPNSYELRKKFERYLENRSVGKFYLSELAICAALGASFYIIIVLSIINASKLTNEFIYFNF
jgi:alginate O-acetyltransferase complex protein AlgI